MKRILLLVLILTLCFVGCKEEIPEKPVENITEEVKEPIEETKTPVEKVEVPEVEEPVEVTPTEPEIEEPHEETPTEPEVEEPVKEDKTIVVLDFPYEPYVEHELVSPKEFEWGEYFPLVSYSDGEIIRPGWVDLYKYRVFGGVLSNEVTTLQDAIDLHDLMESKLQELENDTSLSSLSEEAPCDRKVYDSLDFVDQNGIKISTFLDAVIDNKYIIFEGINTENKYQALFSYNIETKESEVLATLVYDFSLSPDGKYLAYSSPAGEYFDIADISNYFGSNVLSMRKGFYVQNLENGQATFYSCNGYCPEDYCIYHSMQWISKENYKRLKT